MLAGNTGLPTGQLLGLLAETDQCQQNPTPSVATDIGTIHARLGLLLNSMMAPADKKPEAVPVEFSGQLLRVFQDYEEAVAHLSLLHVSATSTPSALAALHTTTAGVKNLDWMTTGTEQQSLTSLATRLRDLRAAQEAENTAGPVADPVGDYLTQLRTQRAHASPHQIPLYAEWEVQFRNFVQKAAACVDILHQEILRFFKQHKALPCIASDASKQTLERLRRELIGMVLWRLERDLSASGVVLPLFAVQLLPPSSGNRRTATTSNPAMQFNNRLLAFLKGDFLRQLGGVGVSDTPAVLAQLFTDHLDTLFIAMEDNWKEVETEAARVKTIQNQLLATDDDYKRRKAALYGITYTFDNIFHVRRGGPSTIGVRYDEIQRNTIRQLKSDCDQLWLMQMDSVGEPELQVSSSRWGAVLGGPRGGQMSGHLAEALRQSRGRQKNPFAFAPEKATLRFIEDQRKKAAVLQIPQQIPTTKTSIPVESMTQRTGSPTKTEWAKTPAPSPPSAPAAKLPPPQSSGFVSHPPLTTRPEVTTVSDTCVHRDSAWLQGTYDFLELHPCPGVFLQEVPFETHPRFAAAMNRLFIKRNNKTAQGQKEVTEQEGVVRGIVAELALELRENTLRAVQEMPFLGPRVNGVLLALLLPTFEHNDVFRTLLMERQNTLNDSALPEHLREHRLTLTEECLREKAEKLSATVPQTIDTDRAAVSVIILNRLLEASTKKKSTSPATSPRTSTRTAPPQPVAPAAAKAVESRGPATSPVQAPSQAAARAAPPQPVAPAAAKAVESRGPATSPVQGPSQAAARAAPPQPVAPAAAEVIDSVVHGTTAAANVAVNAAGEELPGCDGLSVPASTATVVNGPTGYGWPLPELEFTSITDFVLESNRSLTERRKVRRPQHSSPTVQPMRPTATREARHIASKSNGSLGSTEGIAREPLAEPPHGGVRSSASLTITSSELKPTDPTSMCDPMPNSRSSRLRTTVPVNVGGERPCATYGVLLYKSKSSSRAQGADTETASCARRKVPLPESGNGDTSAEPVTKPSVTSVTEKRTAAAEPPRAVKDSFATAQGPASSCHPTGVPEQNPTTSEGACDAVIKALRCSAQPRSSFQQSVSRLSLSNLSTSDKKLPTTAGTCGAVTRSPFKTSAAPRLELGRVRQQQVIVPITPVVQHYVPLTSADDKSIRTVEDNSVDSSSARSPSAGKRTAGLPPVCMDTTAVRRVSSGAGSPNEMRVSEQSYSFCYNRWKKVDSPENANIPAGSQLTTPLELCSRLNSASAISSLPTMERQQPTRRSGSSEGSTPLLLRAEDIERRHQQEKSKRLREWTQLLSRKVSPSVSHYSSTAQQRLSDSRPHSQEEEQRQRVDAASKGTSPRRADRDGNNHAPAPKVNTSQQPPPPRMAASRTDWRSATFSGMKPSIPPSASSSPPTVTASLYCNRTVGVTTPNLRKLEDSDPAPRPTVSVVHTRYVHRSDENKSLTAGGVSQQSATPSSSHLSACGVYQALLREQAEQNQNLKATVEGKFEFLHSRSPPISPSHTTSLLQSCRTSMASGKMAAHIANTTGGALSLKKELQFEPGTPLSKIYSTACMAYGMRPNSGLLRTFPSTAGTYLQTLDLAVNYVGAKSLLPLFHVLENNAGRLQTLIFSNNNLENREVLDLVAVLMGEAGDSLMSLDLSFNPVSQAAGQVLLQLATARPHITLLKLKGTLIPPKLMQSILEKVEDNEYRKHIGLRR